MKVLIKYKFVNKYKNKFHKGIIHAHFQIKLKYFEIIYPIILI